MFHNTAYFIFEILCYVSVDTAMAEVATLACNGHIPHPQETETKSNNSDPFGISALPLPQAIDDATFANQNSTTCNNHDSELPELPPLTTESRSDKTLTRMIASPLPPSVPIDTYSLEYGPVTESEPQLDSPSNSPKLDGEMPRFDGLNDHYEFLRRTLSHSRTRYSARFKRPRPRPTSDTESSLDAPGKLRRPDQSSLDAPGKARSPLSTTSVASSSALRHKHHTVRGVHPQNDLVTQRAPHHNNRTSMPVTSGAS